MSVIEESAKGLTRSGVQNKLLDPFVLNIRYLPQVRYRDALAWQHALIKSRSSYLLLLEHSHVYTAGIRTKPEHILLDDFSSVNAEFIRADRGGDVTYHGPGQLVGYFITDVKLSKDAIPNHVRKIEQLVIDVLDEAVAVASDSLKNTEKEKISFVRKEAFPGVWVHRSSGKTEKICSVGVRVSRGRSMHGFALNISTDMKMFSHIVPCGINDYSMTSLRELGYGYSVDDIATLFIRRAGQLMDEVSGGGQNTPVTLQQRPSLVSEFPKVTQDLCRNSVTEEEKNDSTSALLLNKRAMRLEKAGAELSTSVNISSKKPDWLRAKLSTEKNFFSSYKTVRSNGLVTVCEEAGCPNISECWSEGTATFMINGDRCTRSCGFCLIDTSKPLPLDPTEPLRVAKAVEKMGLSHAVVTAVARDDLSDGGAAAFASTIREIRKACPGVSVEVLIPDCKGNQDSLDIIFDEKPDVLNHNVETVLRLQGAVRPQASYARSLAVLARAKQASLVTKSSLMVGLSETKEEIIATLLDLLNVGVQIVTIGQYLRPTSRHLPVVRWWSEKEFAELKEEAYSLGFDHVECSPLTRSSYHAKKAVTAVEATAGSEPCGVL